MKDSPGKSEPTVFHRFGDPGNHGVPLPEPVRLEDGRAIFGAAAGQTHPGKNSSLERRTDGPLRLLSRNVAYVAGTIGDRPSLLFNILHRLDGVSKAGAARPSRDRRRDVQQRLSKWFLLRPSNLEMVAIFRL
jgi:hypothetical protein